MAKKIIVLIPHYNNIIELIESISSIDEEIKIDVHIVDDGSAIIPNLRELQKKYTQGDISLNCLQKNVGIEYALNAGLEDIEKLDYDYIARLDCGDLNIKNKYADQINYLEQHPDVFLLGTWADIVDVDCNFLYTLKLPTSYHEIKRKMYLNNMFVHPSVVFRSEVLLKIGHYPTYYEAAEDYGYFFNIVKELKSENLPKVYLKYKIDPKSISSTKRRKQVKSRIRIILAHFKIGFYPIYGLIRNILLLTVSRKVTTFFKKKITH